MQTSKMSAADFGVLDGPIMSRDRTTNQGITVHTTMLSDTNTQPFISSLWRPNLPGSSESKQAEQAVHDIKGMIRSLLSHSDEQCGADQARSQELVRAIYITIRNHTQDEEVRRVLKLK